MIIRKNCPCAFHTVEYITYDEYMKKVEHYYECWICGNIVNHEEKWT